MVLRLASYISLALISILFVACYKDSKPLFDGTTCIDKCLIIHGKVIDSANNKGLPGSTVKFFHKTVTSNFLADNTTFIGKTKTDQNGEYSFKFPGEDISKPLGYFYAEVFKDNLFVDPLYGNRFPAFDLDSTHFNIPQRIDFALFRPATLKVRIIANSTINYQFITITYNYGKIGNGFVLNGPRNIDTLISLKTAGDIRTFVKADMTGNGLLIVKSDTVIVESGKSKQIEFRF